MRAFPMDYLDLLQWPAMLVTVTAAWLIGSRQRPRRNLGFWVFLASNALWIAWGLHAHAWALIVLQLCLAVMNIRGARKTDAESSAGSEAQSGAKDEAGSRR